MISPLYIAKLWSWVPPRAGVQCCAELVAHLMIGRLVHELGTVVDGTNASAEPARPDRHKKEVCFMLMSAARV